MLKDMFNLEKFCFAHQLINWYQAHKRDLPWRRTKVAYQIWLSEIILQQTRVAQGLPYYERFMAKYPNIHALAEASEQDILRLWQGLGYYTRARKLHACAMKVVVDYQGVFPKNYLSLLKLPGIGPYTAAAIASIAFDERVAVIDGNVYRVLARIFGIEAAINSTEGKAIFHSLANQLIDTNAPAIYNQAIMEFGALHCTPKQPKCLACVFKSNCKAFLTGQQTVLPNKLPKAIAKKRFFHYLVMRDQQGNFFMNIRKKGDIWQGLYDFYLLERHETLDTEQLLTDPLIALAKQYQLEINLVPKRYKHILTHQVLYATFFTLTINEAFLQAAQKCLQSHQLTAFAPHQAHNLPKPKLICCFLADFYYI